MIMRIEDNRLARKLLDVRSDLNLVRAQQSCQEHAEMLDDVTYELEEEEEITGLIKGRINIKRLDGSCSNGMKLLTKRWSS